jgi:lipopolysaccharide export LptBFGC system permease protein LptF
MNATLTDKNEVNNYVFDIEHKGNKYEVIVYTKDGKFYDEQIFFNEEELDYDEEEGQIREDIMTYLDENWDKLID